MRLKKGDKWSNEWIRQELENRGKLETRIRELGGQVPREKWPWDEDGQLRNLQLLEEVERLEAEQK